MHNWQHDPYSRGAYSYRRVGGVEAGDALARPVERTLFFAGEATDEASGTVEGALASGRKSRSPGGQRARRLAREAALTERYELTWNSLDWTELPSTKTSTL